MKGLACLRNGKTASVARADRARSTGPEKPRSQLSRQARRLHAFAGHYKDLDGISARWEVIKEFRQRNNALKTAFLKIMLVHRGDGLSVRVYMSGSKETTQQPLAITQVIKNDNIGQGEVDTLRCW